MVENNAGEIITEDEAALYDRQIRLWGLDAQKRLRASRVLLIGLGGLGAEVAKNLVLSGIKSITLLDHHNVAKEDSCSQFLVSRDDVGKNRAESSQARTQLLNPMVEVAADTGKVEDKPDEFFTQFSVICATCCSREQLIRINSITHTNDIRFYAGDVWGFYGFMFADLNKHDYAEEIRSLPTVKKAEQTEEEDGSGEPSAKKPKQDIPDTTTVKKDMEFVRLQNALEVDWSEASMVKRLKRTPNVYFITQVLLEFRHKQGRDPDAEYMEADRAELLKIVTEVAEKLKVKPDTVPADFEKHCLAELSPVCAVVGGVLAQEIIKAVSHKDPPHRNFFFYNGVEGSGTVDFIGE